MLTMTASLRARHSASTAPSRGSSREGSRSRERDDLGGDAQRGLRADVLDARGDLGLVALAPQLRAAGVEEVAGHEVQEVLPRALGAPVAKARELLLEVLVVAALDEGHELVSRSRASPVTRLESEWVLEETKYSGASPSGVLVEVGAHGRPPAPRHALVADLGAAEHAHAHRLALARRSPAGGPRSARPRRRPAAPSRRARRPAPPRTPRRWRPRSAASRRPACAGGSCSTRSGRRRASARGRRRRTPRPAGRPAPRRRCRTSAGAAPAASTASHCSSGPIPARGRAPPPGP